MAIEERTVDVVVCDSCNTEGFLIDNKMPMGWYSGDANLVNGRSTKSGTWHACRPAHIKKAVMLATGTSETITEEVD